ncbi:MBL fold metallo-hydrolase [Antarcticimicrobium luteum]|uniref:MBL fold metallo-hydrolase n=1 Tax=Antarcticimicrobium luteum TaxID=2547397 RepID=A0A4R5VFB0_9RHOB|nr:MBL fold metallo-hydrolase [Antarcticimicrobium luteum]TDK51185.1 MBL fold metallo-hydrolase [Antarcticimicrobium luteum]
MSRTMEGIARHQVGETEVFCLTDGLLDLGPDVFPEVAPARREAAHPGGVRIEANVHLLRHGDGALDLVDTGCGPLIYGGAGGRLPALLASLGIAPDRIGRIIFTHLHGDHAAGALDAGGRPVFPAAKILMHEKELAFWQGREDTAGGRLIAACGDRIETVRDGDDLGHGLRVWFLPGHTPGHIGLRLGAGFALIGDLVHSVQLQIGDPTVHTRYDTDSAQGDATRQAAFETIAEEGLVISGGHLMWAEKFLRLERDGAGFRSVAP